MHCPRPLLLAIVVVACHVHFICCVTLELYSGRDYSDFLKTVTAEKDDENKCIMPGGPFTIKSIKTDKCVILYENAHCLHTPGGWFPESAYSYRIDSNTDHFDVREDLYTENKFGDKQEDDRVFTSFHVCSDELGGGTKLSVDVYGWYHNHWSDTLKRWKGVCKCENIPDLIHNKVYSINNHGNSVYVFNKEDCRGEATLIPAGDSEVSRYIGVPRKKNDPPEIRSFRPAGPLDCLKLDASIYRFTFFNGSLSGEPLEKNVQMAATQSTKNNGSLPMTQETEYSKSVAHTVEYSVANAFTQIHSVGVAPEVETESLAGIHFIGLEKVKLSLKDNYRYTSNHHERKATKTTVTEMGTVKATSRVQVAACETCDVTGYIKAVRDFPINYTALAVVKGMAGEDQLTAGEIRDYLPPGMEYIRDHDEYNVLVSVNGSMRAEFSWKTFVTKDCEPVPNCGGQNRQNEPREETHEIFNVPFVAEVSEEETPFCGKNEFQMPFSTTCDFHESFNW